MSKETFLAEVELTGGNLSFYLAQCGFENEREKEFDTSSDIRHH